MIGFGAWNLESPELLVVVDAQEPSQRAFCTLRPTHTSWLNQIECWFSILSRQALQGASFVDIKQLREGIDHFICAYNEQAAPFEWPN